MNTKTKIVIEADREKFTQACDDLHREGFMKMLGMTTPVLKDQIIFVQQFEKHES